MTLFLWLYQHREAGVGLSAGRIRQALNYQRNPVQWEKTEHAVMQIIPEKNGHQ